MYLVQCPDCCQSRMVKAKKRWMKGSIPYSRICKSCCQKGKEKTQEHKDKLSISVSAIQTEELRKKKSEFMKAHPEFWRGKVATGEGGGWNKGLKTGARDEETKEKISETMKRKKEK